MFVIQTNLNITATRFFKNEFKWWAFYWKNRKIKWKLTRSCPLKHPTRERVRLIITAEDHTIGLFAWVPTTLLCRWVDCRWYLATGGACFFFTSVTAKWDSQILNLCFWYAGKISLFALWMCYYYSNNWYICVVFPKCCFMCYFLAT